MDNAAVETCWRNSAPESIGIYNIRGSTLLPKNKTKQSTELNIQYLLILDSVMSPFNNMITETLTVHMINVVNKIERVR